MKRLACVALVVLACACLAGVLGGCSGAGAPAVPGDLQTLQSIANDQVTAVRLVQRWVSLLYGIPDGTGAAGAQGCQPESRQVPSLPSDPPGSQRFRHTWADCTTVDELVLADGSSTEVRHYADGSESTFAFDAVRQVAGWTVRSAHAQLADGAKLDFEAAHVPFSPTSQQRKSGTVTLADGRQMAFGLDHDRVSDRLTVDPDDGSHLDFEVPLLQEWPPGRPAFAERSQGSFRNPNGHTSHFELTGVADGGWQEWTLRSQGNVAGSFSLAPDLSGSGQLHRAGQLLAALTWAADSRGQLTPVGAGASEATPSAAARDFQIDRWIHSVADLGPSPHY